MAAAAPLFDAAQLTSFFEGPDFMALSNRTRLQLALEGITVPDDFIDFDADGLEGIFLNLQKPPKVPATGAAAIAAGRLREIMAYEVSAKSKMRLKGAQKIAKFYEDVGRDLDPQNMTWLVIKRFLEQWKALMERKKEDFGLPPSLPKTILSTSGWNRWYCTLDRRWEFVMLPSNMWFGPWHSCPPSPLLFRWANHTLKNMDQSRVILLRV